MFFRPIFPNRDYLVATARVRPTANLIGRLIGDMSLNAATGTISCSAQTVTAFEFGQALIALLNPAALGVEPYPFWTVLTAALRTTANQLGRLIGDVVRSAMSASLDVGPIGGYKSEFEPAAGAILELEPIEVMGYPFWQVNPALVRVRPNSIGLQIGAVNRDGIAAAISLNPNLILGANSEFAQLASLSIQPSVAEGQRFWSALTASLAMRSQNSGRIVGERLENSVSATVSLVGKTVTGTNSPVGDSGVLQINPLDCGWQNTWVSAVAMLGLTANSVQFLVEPAAIACGTARFQLAMGVGVPFSTANAAAASLTIGATTGLEYQAAFTCSTATMNLYASLVASSEAAVINIYEVMLMNLTPAEADVDLWQYEGWSE